MRHRFSKLPLVFLLFALVSCGGKEKESPEPGFATTARDSIDGERIEKPGPATDSTLGPVRIVIEKELVAWIKSFKNFNADSFHLAQTTSFPEIDYGQDELQSFYELYKPAISFSPDSSQFIDLYSAGLMLERKGKKIIASADVDNAVTLYNRETKSWKRIASFGPSAWIEEAIWTSQTNFALAGIMVNEEGEQQAFIMLGDTNNKSFRWFESNSVRLQSAKYEASGMAKLKIDEWE